MNYVTANVTNDEIVPVGPDGKIAINVSGGATNITVDVTGYFTTNLDATNASTYTPLANSSRVLLTTTGVGVAKGTVAASSPLVFHVANNNGITGAPVTPAAGTTVTAVALNIGALPPSDDNGWIAAYANGATRNPESTVTFEGPQTSADTVIVPVSASNREIDIYNGSGSAIDLVGDLAGDFITSATGQFYHPVNPVHVVDTRSTKSGAVASDKTIGFSTPSSLTADNPSLVLNVTVVSPANAGYLNAYPGSQSSPAPAWRLRRRIDHRDRHHREYREREQLRHRQRVGQRKQHHHCRHWLLRLGDRSRPSLARRQGRPLNYVRPCRSGSGVPAVAP